MTLFLWKLNANFRYKCTKQFQILNQVCNINCHFETNSNSPPVKIITKIKMTLKIFPPSKDAAQLVKCLGRHNLVLDISKRKMRQSFERMSTSSRLGNWQGLCGTATSQEGKLFLQILNWYLPQFMFYTIPFRFVFLYCCPLVLDLYALVFDFKTIMYKIFFLYIRF